MKYRSREWLARELERRDQQLLEAERQAYALQVRINALSAFIAAKGLPLDEAGIREAHVAETARTTLLENDVDRLEGFRTSMVMLVHEGTGARGRVNDTALAEALLKGTKRALKTCDRKDMPAAQARQQAESAYPALPR